MKGEAEEQIDMVAALDANRDMLQRLVILMDGLSERVEEMMMDLARIKESQNQLLAGRALQERVKRVKEELFGLEVELPEGRESDLSNVEAFCSNCIRMTPVAEPIATMKDGLLTVRGTCGVCGAIVFRILY
jgi:hypothetical protein